MYRENSKILGFLNRFLALRGYFPLTWSFLPTVYDLTIGILGGIIGNLADITYTFAIIRGKAGPANALIETS
jgi:hypothetical protein